MNLCKTCKFWSLPDDKKWRAKDICQPIDPETYELMKTDFQVMVCTCPKIVWFERQLESTGVSLIDGSDYYAEMLTAENFGCVNHEAG